MAYLYIYRNLRTGGFSVRHLGKVVRHIDTAVALDVRFKVNPAGRDRVIREGQKNVHSFVVSAGLALTKQTSVGRKQIQYNPYLTDSFTVDGKPIHRAAAVLFENGKCYLLGR